MTQTKKRETIELLSGKDKKLQTNQMMKIEIGQFGIIGIEHK